MPRDNSARILARIASNRAKQCSVEGCFKHRDQLSKYCLAHTRKARRYGDPNGKLIPKADLRRHRATVTNFFSKHANHPGLAVAKQEMQRLLDCWMAVEQSDLIDRRRGFSEYSGRILGGRELRRLVDAGVTADEALEWACAVYLFAKHNPRDLPDDDRLTMAYGTTLFRLRPRESRIVFVNGEAKSRRQNPVGAIPRRWVGTQIRRRLGIFFQRVHEGLIADVEARSRAKAPPMELETPFLPKPSIRDGWAPDVF